MKSYLLDSIDLLHFLKQHFITFVNWIYWCGLEKRTLHIKNFFNEMFLACRVPTFRGQNVVQHGGHQGFSCLFIDRTRSNLCFYWKVRKGTKIRNRYNHSVCLCGGGGGALKAEALKRAAQASSWKRVWEGGRSPSRLSTPLAFEGVQGDIP